MFQHWTVGDVEITCVTETTFDVPPEVLIRTFAADDATVSVDHDADAHDGRSDRSTPVPVEPNRPTAATDSEEAS